jgi:peptidoglycan/LPS O-acetylase OafA/YrhL
VSHIAALDGLRAVAVLAVMAFHFGVGWLPGGFIGVDVFYVLSGFLITGLLLAEWRRSASIRLGTFWARRARRLLPCLVLVLVAVSLWVRYLAPPGTYPGYRMDALSALFYFSNWWQIHTASSYFVATGAVSPLTHTWSLAIEEQFYLVWPVVVLGVLKLCRTFRRAVRALLALAAVGAAASVTEMAALYRMGASTTRLYFGTDTHAQCVLVGAALACGLGLLAHRQGVDSLVPRFSSAGARRALTVLGLVGSVGLAVVSTTLNGSSPLTYEGGFALCALAAAAVITVATCQVDGAVARLLSVRPLVLLGVVSYGVYLWHFPIDVFVTPARMGISGLPLMGVQFALTVAMATASYVFVERPILSGTFWRSLRSAVPAGAAIGATLAVIWATTVVPASATTSVRRYSAPPAAGDAAAPRKVAVLGDSTAGVLEVALTATAPPGITVVDGAIAGCGLAVGTNSSNQVGKEEQAMFPGCNESQPADQLWPARDAATVSGVGRGDVVLFLAGQWETQDLLIHGRWTNILQPSFRRYELHQLRTLVAVATARGAHLDLLTMPAMETHGEYASTGVMDSGPANPASFPRRRDLYNGLLLRTAAAYPGKVSVLDYGELLSPHGTFTEYLDGVQVRAPDGVHTPAYEAGNAFFTDTTPAVADDFYRWLSPRIWPAIVASAHPGLPSPTVRLPPTGS